MLSRKFTVIIPTRERSGTLVSTLRSVLSQTYSNIEVVVSDNHSTDSTEQVAKGFEDPRIIYVNTGRRVSMAANWEFALGHATGDWLTILGDDDALLPNSVRKVNAIIDCSGVDAVRSALCHYSSPCFAPDANLARLIVPRGTGWEIRHSHDWLRKVLLGDESYCSLPSIYTGGFVNRSVVESTKQHGRFFHSSIPDVFSSILLSNVLEKYAFSLEPLAVNGASKASTGASFQKANTDHAYNTFLFENDIPFHPNISIENQKPPSVQALVYESCYQVADLLTDSVTLPVEQQIESIIRCEPEASPELIKWCKFFANKNGIDLSHPLKYREKSLKRLWKRFMRMKSMSSYTTGDKERYLEDVYVASVLAEEIVSSRPTWLRVACRRLTNLGSH